MLRQHLCNIKCKFKIYYRDNNRISSRDSTSLHTFSFSSETNLFYWSAYIVVLSSGSLLSKLNANSTKRKWIIIQRQFLNANKLCVYFFWKSQFWVKGNGYSEAINQSICPLDKSIAVHTIQILLGEYSASFRSCIN